MAEVYSSLYKGNVHITQSFSSTHKAIDIGNYKTRNPIYSPNKLGSGTVSKITTSYTSGGVVYNNTLTVWITYDTGYVMSMYHGEVGDKVVSVGDKVVVGQQIYRTGNTGHSHGDHLHCMISKGGVYIDPAPLVINDLNVSIFKIGDEIEVTGVQNIRKGSGTSYPITGQTKIGDRYFIEGGPRIADGYTWWDLKGADWIAEVGKFKKYVPPVIDVPAPPVEVPTTPDCDEYIKKVEILQKEIEGLKLAVESSEGLIQEKDNKIKLLEERNTFLESTMAIRNEEIKQLELEIVKLREEKDRFEKQYIGAVTELNELKEGRDSWINRLADMLHKLFGGK